MRNLILGGHLIYTDKDGTEHAGLINRIHPVGDRFDQKPDSRGRYPAGTKRLPDKGEIGITFFPHVAPTVEKVQRVPYDASGAPHSWRSDWASPDDLEALGPEATVDVPKTNEQLLEERNAALAAELAELKRAAAPKG